MASSCLSLSRSFASGTRPRLATRSRLAACSSADWESLTSAARLLPYAASACAAPDTVSTRLTSKPRSSEVWSPRLGSRLLPASSSRGVVIATVPSRFQLRRRHVAERGRRLAELAHRGLLPGGKRAPGQEHERHGQEEDAARKSGARAGHVVPAICRGNGPRARDRRAVAS